MTKVTVIIPTYNRAEYLCAAIRSVLNQTFQDFEIVVIDDASTDNTSEMVSSFNNKKIKYLCHASRKGGAAARNTGIMNSSSKYIAFIDDDDEWISDKLRMQFELLESCSPKVGGIYTGHMEVNDNGNEIVRIWSPKRRGNIYNDMFSANWVSTTSSILLRRDCFDRVGLFDESLTCFQDYDMWIRISREFEFDYIDRPLVKYRIHGNKVWTNLESLNRGMELMLQKYGHLPVFRKNISHYYLSLGVNYCYRGDVKNGREAFLKAIKLYPFEIRHYFNLFLSVLGADAFKRFKGMKERLIVSLRDGKT